MTNRILRSTGLLACLLAPASAALGHGGGGDIAVFETDGQVDVGFAILDDDDIEQVAFDPTDKVFQAVLTPLVGSPAFIPWDVGSSEPGYDANETDLPAEAEIRWNTVAISHWDGAGQVAFAPTTAVEGGYAPQPNLTDSLGGFHAHPTFGLSDLTDDGAPIADGVYLVELTASVTGLADSDPFYLVTLVDNLVSSQADPVAAAEALGEATRNFIDDPAAGAPELGGKDFSFYADAIGYAESLVIPEPGTALLAAAALAAAAARRR
ncbi:PEP-CTERM sorting domain-containing protein [Botrimarina sp.]|uniref:PEP-CTERM sorting domain-containing protein n=1 Tax=Botrimarina sp. TaxID=2795802 RepID=UPI0032EE976B